jgi:redox-sensitive bicupin YhaK (pirin superfamily)
VNDPVLQTVPLGMQWPTVDPFLFCVHHVDAYPRGNDALGPDASLAGRDLGQDFAGVDGWRMYHGETVPGFPQHPHRGFETVTYVRRGYIDHSDSLGAVARFGAGDTQWITAGRGLVHSEMFPLLERDRENPVELFQIWLNLARADKMAEPYFTMLWSDAIPVVTAEDPEGRTTRVTVVAGALDGHEPPAPPPSSWASRADADVAIWVIRMDAGARWMLPPARHAATVRTLYVYGGAGLTIGGTDVDAQTGAVVRCDEAVEIAARGEAPVEVLMLQGRPIGEPVEQYGPFVMNDRAGVQQAFDDYRRTGFGGWPWPADDPVLPRDQSRFARYPDGKVEQPT